MYYLSKKWTTAKKQEYNGFKYDSGFEANYAAELDLRIKAKEIKGFDRQVNLDLIVNNYIVYHNDGITEYVECKDYPTGIWKNKWKLFEALYYDKPDIKLSIVQQGKYKPPKPRKVKYSNP